MPKVREKNIQQIYYIKFIFKIMILTYSSITFTISNRRCCCDYHHVSTLHFVSTL